MTQPIQPLTRTRYQISPYHFTDRPHEMIAFLQAVGLRVEASRDGWADLVGSGGRVGVHPLATSGVTVTSTSLCLLAPDAVAVADQLQQVGLEARWWDEAFGRQAAVRGPYGELTINEPMTDFHGYQRHDVTPAPGDPEVSVTAVLFVPDFSAPAAFFSAFGFVGDERLQGWRPLRSGRTSGAIGLHAAGRDPEPGYACGLSFDTTEDLAAFADRLRGLGYPVDDEYDATAPHVTVSDPDGNPIEVHAAPPRA
jgi:glyoxalase/bleomycin resistance protein/dioxygenase superfamily protein